MKGCIYVCVMLKEQLWGLMARPAQVAGADPLPAAPCDQQPYAI